MAAFCPLRFFSGALSSRSTATTAIAALSPLSLGFASSTRSLAVSASSPSSPRPPSSSCSTPPPMETLTSEKAPGWKPMCLYYTQGKCTMMNDSMHLEKFNHNLSMDLQVKIRSNHLCTQDLDYLLVLDLEGKVEILEFPIVMINARTMDFVDSFHRFVRPSRMVEHRIKEYIEGKYGKLGVDRVWHDTAVPFREVLEEFEIWMTNHNLWNKELGRSLNQAAFVTCGNWDLKTKIPQQCRDSGIKLPPYFMEWINLKDIYLNFYKRRATGMMTMMRELRIPLMGNHHLGIDDSKNIARVVQHMIGDGAWLQITARRRSSVPGDVEFLFEDRIR